MAKIINAREIRLNKADTSTPDPYQEHEHHIVKLQTIHNKIKKTSPTQGKVTWAKIGKITNPSHRKTIANILRQEQNNNTSRNETHGQNKTLQRYYKEKNQTNQTKIPNIWTTPRRPQHLGKSQNTRRSRKIQKATENNMTPISNYTKQI